MSINSQHNSALVAMRAVMAAACFSLSACSTTDGLAPTVSYSGFDRSRIVDVAPHGTTCSTHPCISIGAQWTSALPDAAMLHVAFIGEIRAITSMSMSIDGRRLELKPVRHSTEFDTSNKYIIKSMRSFHISTDDIIRITKAHSVWVRVGSSGGYLEDLVIDGDRDTKALHALKRFSSQISTNGGSKMIESRKVE